MAFFNQKLIIITAKFVFALCVIFLMAGCSGSDKAENWTHFRGSQMDGHARTKTAPLEWSENSNVVWKTEVKGKGYSSPVVYGNQIWMTSAADDGLPMTGRNFTPFAMI